MTLFNVNYLLKPYLQLQSDWKLGLQHLNLGRLKRSVHSKQLKPVSFLP